MNPENIINVSSTAIEKVWQSERTLFIGMMVIILLFVWFLIRESSLSQSQARNAFLASMEKRDEKMEASLEKVTTALGKITEIMIKTESKIK